MLKINRRTRLSDSTGVRFLRHLHREEAETLHASGQIIADETRGDAVVSFRLTPVRFETPFRIGSFGVDRQHVPVGNQYGLSGGIVFSHRYTYDRSHA